MFRLGTTSVGMTTSTDSCPSLGIGIDIVAVERFKDVDLYTDTRFLERTFTPREVAESMDGVNSASSLAGRFALKESVIKALPKTPLTLLDLNRIEVRKGSDGSPEVHRVGGTEIEYDIYSSLAHDDEYAVASVIVIPKYSAIDKYYHGFSRIRPRDTNT